MINGIKRSVLDEIFTRVCVCLSFQLSGIEIVLKHTDFPIEPVELIWMVGELNAKDYVRLDSSISNYLVNREKAELMIEELENSPLLCPVHDAWLDWYRNKYETYFNVDDLASLLYYEVIYIKRCGEKDGNVLDVLTSKTQDYLWMYCFSLAKKLGVPLLVSLKELRAAFDALIVYVESRHQDKYKEVTEYLPTLIQQFRQIKDANMFKGILSSSEYEAFIQFLRSLQP